MSENRTCLILFPMGKVKINSMGKSVCAQKYQFPMGKVKSHQEVITHINFRINSLWKR